jgi:hypothetical protein
MSLSAASRQLFSRAIAVDNTAEMQNAFHTLDDTCVIKGC